ncbi:MAG TPA: hypothetical protein PK453_05530 [Leptospiraceae bacterium]|nr:hypothetical protein [Leptospiraceae bacterium]HNF13110.1 hypothetical protein [Leptospiraceae bacterium]HNF23645.1 hypothetical protein [Leptospiraceae bacterium]HNM02024.1 hypothetical protein [Leptospiraceae bacterium]HNN04559.1 hypothetical protein [Leptospiraceae bacterium]
MAVILARNFIKIRNNFLNWGGEAELDEKRDPRDRRTIQSACSIAGNSIT